MSDENDMLMQVFFEIHSGLKREAPGSEASTRRALAAAVGALGHAPERALDVGCGPGAHTVELLAAGAAHVDAVDTHRPYLDRVLARAAEMGRGEDVTVHAADMKALPFAHGTFDLIWSEGAVYNMGFPEALAAWRPLLRPNGVLAVSDAVWLRGDPPEEIAAFWNQEYPAMTTHEHNQQMMRDAGYAILEAFPLPEEDWLDGYYVPLEKNIRAALERYREDDAVVGMLREQQQEIELYRTYHEFYGYAFYVAHVSEQVSE